MTSRNRILIITLIALVSACGCSSNGVQSIHQIQRCISALPRGGPNTLILVTENYPPFEFEENGQIIGITVDIAREAFTRMGISVTITIYPFARGIEMTRSGEAQAMVGIYKSQARQEWAYYPNEAVFLDKQCFFGLPGKTIDYDGSIASLQPYRIGVIRDYSEGDAFDEAVASGVLKVEPVDSGRENYEKVLNGRIDAFIDGQYTTLYNLKASGLQNQVVELGVFRESALYVAFSQKSSSQEMADKWDQALDAMKKDGSYQQIIRKYDNYVR